MGVILVTYHPSLQESFEKLNRIWLEEFFEVEPIDEIVFQDPQAYIISPGGEIFFICDRQTTVGTCAIIPVSGDEFELSKMAVDPAHRCLGYGGRLMEAAIDFARKASARKISLITDTKLPSAINLYQRYGFQIVPYSPDPRYKRGNVRMELWLNFQ